MGVLRRRRGGVLVIINGHFNVCIVNNGLRRRSNEEWQRGPLLGLDELGDRLSLLSNDLLGKRNA